MRHANHILRSRRWNAALGIGATMVVALLTVHAKAGFFNPKGVELPLSLLAAAVTLVITRAGTFSLDAIIGKRFAPAETDGIEIPVPVAATTRRVA